MRLPVVALSAFSLLVICDPALARSKSGHRHAHAGHHHARQHGKVHRVRHVGVYKTLRVYQTPAPGGTYGLFPGDDRYPRQGNMAFERRPSAPDLVEPRVARRDRIDGNLGSMISRHAQANGVPEALVRRVVMRESGGNPRVIGRGSAMGLMQIKPATARAMGYTGSAAGLLDPETNMTYAVRYLAGAYRVAGGNHDRAVSNYARGYYYAAKRQGISPYRQPTAGGAYASY